MHYPGSDSEPARYAAAVRDFRGIVLAAVQLTERPGERPATTGVPADRAVVNAAGALSADLGFDR